MGILGDIVATAVSGAIVNKLFCKTNAIWQCEYCGRREGTPDTSKNPDSYSLTNCQAWNYQRGHKWVYMGTQTIK